MTTYQFNLQVNYIAEQVLDELKRHKIIAIKSMTHVHTHIMDKFFKTTKLNKKQLDALYAVEHRIRQIYKSTPYKTKQVSHVTRYMFVRQDKISTQTK